jgi:hypothetical protein
MKFRRIAATAIAATAILAGSAVTLGSATPASAATVKVTCTKTHITKHAVLATEQYWEVENKQACTRRGYNEQLWKSTQHDSGAVSTETLTRNGMSHYPCWYSHEKLVSISAKGKVTTTITNKTNC